MGAAPIMCFKCVAFRDWAKCWRREEPEPAESHDWSRADVKRSKSRSVTSHRLPSTNGLVKRERTIFNDKAIQKRLHTMFLCMNVYFTILRSGSLGWFLFPPDGRVHWEQHYCSQTEELRPARSLLKPSEHPETGLLHHVLCNYTGVRKHCQTQINLYFINALLNK